MKETEREIEIYAYNYKLYSHKNLNSGVNTAAAILSTSHLHMLA